MNTKLASAYLLVAGLSLAPMVGHADDSSMQNTPSSSKDTTGQFVDDATITTKVKAEFLKDSDISSFKIRVKTHKGVVWLRGTVSSQAMADKAVSIAQGVDGVKDVKSKLVVKAD